MRNVSFTQSASRVVSAKAVFTDKRLRFTSVQTSEVISIYSWDADNYGTGILRVASVQESDRASIFVQYLADPTQAWPAWVDTGLDTRKTSKVALFGGRLFYIDRTTNVVHYADFNGTTFGAPASLFTATCATTDPVGLAPVSTTEVFIIHPVANESDASHKAFTVKFNATDQFYGRIYDTTDTVIKFDAVRVNGVDYIYFGEANESRTSYLRRYGTNWSEKGLVVPMDVIDDVSLFALGGISLINGKVFATGILQRSLGLPMHVSMIGPEQFTMGRDLFVALDKTGAPGKFILVGNKVWYTAPGATFSAPATQLVGYANADLTTTVQNLIGAQMDSMSNQAFGLNLDIPYTLTHAAIRPGSEVELINTINGTDYSLGKFGIDLITGLRDYKGVRKQIQGRSSAMKAISQWQSDAPFDYWSQTKVNTNIADMDQVIRLRGSWKEDADKNLYLDSVNEDGFLYFTAKSCHNGVTRAKFHKIAGDVGYRMGVGISYYVETKYDASIRLNKTVYEVGDGDLFNNGIFAIYGTSEHQGSHAIALYQVVNSVFVPLKDISGTQYYFAVDFGDTTDYWLELQNKEGKITVRYRNSTMTNWVTAIDIPSSALSKYNNFAGPWSQDELGMAAIYAKNVTPQTNYYSFGSADKIIPVDDTSSFPASDSVMIDNEIINYTKSGFDYPINITVPTSNNILFGGTDINSDLSTAQNIGLGIASTTMWYRSKIVVAATCYLTALDFGVEIFGNGPYDNVPDLIVGIYKNDATTAKPRGTPLWEKRISYSEWSTKLGYYPLTIFLQKPIQLTTSTVYYFMVSVPDGVAPNSTGYWGFKIWPFTTGQKGCTNLQPYNATTKTWGTADATKKPWSTLYTMTSLGSYASYANYCCCSCEIPEANPAIDVMKDAAVFQYGKAIGKVVRNDPTGNILVISVTAPFIWTYNTVQPYLQITGRGVNNTNALAHTGGKVSIYRAAPMFLASTAQYYSSDKDLSLEDVTRELARKAGIETLITDDIYPTTINPSTNTTAIVRRDLIIKANIGTLNGTVKFEAHKADASSSGVGISISTTGVSYYSGTTLKEFFPYIGIKGDLVISIFEDTMSLWCDGTYVHTFTLDTADAALDGETFTISGTHIGYIAIHIPESCQRIDNYILDEGKQGDQLLSSLIGEKLFYYQDTPDGSLRLFRVRSDVNAADPYTLATNIQEADNDVPVATRIRVEGAELNEQLDEALMIEYGNVYALINMNEINNTREAKYYNGVQVEEAGSRYKTASLNGPEDPRVEPNDIFYYTTPDGTKKIIVDNVSFGFTIDDKQATLDMALNGRAPRSEVQ